MKLQQGVLLAVLFTLFWVVGFKKEIPLPNLEKIIVVEKHTPVEKNEPVQKIAYYIFAEDQHMNLNVINSIVRPKGFHHAFTNVPLYPQPKAFRLSRCNFGVDRCVTRMLGYYLRTHPFITEFRFIQYLPDTAQVDLERECSAFTLKKSEWNDFISDSTEGKVQAKIKC